jgi:hypothetical protein
MMNSLIKQAGLILGFPRFGGKKTPTKGTAKGVENQPCLRSIHPSFVNRLSIPSKETQQRLQALNNHLGRGCH